MADTQRRIGLIGLSAKGFMDIMPIFASVADPLQFLGLEVPSWIPAKDRLLQNHRSPKQLQGLS